MIIFRYCLQTALKSIWREKWIHLLTILSISIGLLIVCMFAIVTLNMDSLLQKWSKSFGIIVYLNDAVGSGEEEILRNRLRKDSDIVEINYISKEEAVQELKQTLGSNAVVLDAFNDNPLPASFEMKLKPRMLEPERVRQKAEEIRKLPGVEDVQYGEKWLSSLNTISRAMQISAIVFGITILIAIAFITYSTIKIFFYRKKDEIETLKLLGATKTYARLPFLIEGICIGALGGIASALAIFGAYSFATMRVAEFLPSINLFVSSLPVTAYVIIPFAGAAMSFVGSFIAVGKIRY